MSHSVNTCSQSTGSRSAATVSSFKSFCFNPLVESAVASAGYRVPTPIQAQTIPLILEGRDVMGLAQTGTGKTAAFVLPLLQRLLAKPGSRVRALIVVPTRELAEQINGVIRTFSSGMPLRSVTVYGGVNKGLQVRALRSGADIVVACPGRLLDHLGDGTVYLRGVEVLVLDEADQMFDMGFLPDIKKILAHVPTARQTLLFSATMPEEIRSLASDILRDPAVVQIEHKAPAATIKHAVYYTEREKKLPLLAELLKQAQGKAVLVFTRTKHRAMSLGKHVQSLGFRATSIQGNLSQAKRQRAMNGFRGGRFQVLVATDIAARGIDVSDIGYVVNYDMPDTPEAYTHRIGRTGRAHKEGSAYTFVTHEDIGLLRAIERAIGATIERHHLEGITRQMPATAPVQQQPQQRRYAGRYERRRSSPRSSYARAA